MKTGYIKAKDIDKKWFLVDAENQTLGRLSSKVAQILRGKGKVNYTPHMDMGDFVIVINAEKVRITGNKSEQKEYFKHTNYPGGASTTSFKLLKEKKPEFIVTNSIKGMLPHNRLGRQILKHLKVYIGNKHPHSSQNPQKLEL
mgnify:CR=1 FL=1|tara:strand:+ start:85 stop:513 length:429 start_codon:yes stop_codon:yes gene_type:complete